MSRRNGFGRARTWFLGVALLLAGSLGCWEQWSNDWFPQMKWQPQAGSPPCHPFRLPWRFRAQAMVEMQHLQLQPQLLPQGIQQKQEREGIRPTADRLESPVSPGGQSVLPDIGQHFFFQRMHYAAPVL